MEIPSSFGLTPKPTGDGKLALVGTSDTGEPYVARVTETSEVSEADVAALAANDRERTTTKEFMAGLTQQIDRNKQEYADKLYNDYLDPADRVAFAGTHKGSRTLGYSRQYAAKFDSAFGGE